jgi:hypothetical protein
MSTGSQLPDARRRRGRCRYWSALTAAAILAGVAAGYNSAWAAAIGTAATVAAALSHLTKRTRPDGSTERPTGTKINWCGVLSLVA